MDVLYRILKRKIERKQTNGLIEKMDIFFADDKLSKEQYDELREMMASNKEDT